MFRLSRTLRCTSALCAALLLGAELAAQVPQKSDAEIESAWRKLSPARRVEAIEWLRMELRGYDTVQAFLVTKLTENVDVDPGFWPSDGPVPFFESGGKRARLEPYSDRERALYERVRTEPELAWTYDFATRRLVQHGDPNDPELALQYAMHGRHPDVEYVTALVERRLDDGRYREAFAALAHGYSEEDGAVHPFVTIYDVLASGLPLPLQDEDGVGVLSWMLGEDCPFSVPVPPARRVELDRAVLDLFDPADLWRRTVREIASAYLRPDPAALQAADPLELHSLWLSAETEPDLLALRLPDPERNPRFFAEWSQRFAASGALKTNAAVRQADLERSEAAQRELFVWVLDELGAFDAEPYVPPEPLPLPAAQPSDDAVPRVPTLDAKEEARLLERLAKLPQGKLADLLERCSLAARESGSRHAQLVAEWVERAAVQQDELPPATDYGAHDALVYGGGDKRRTLGPGDSAWERLLPQITFEPAPPWPRRADYEFATGRITAPPPPLPTPEPDKGRRKAKKRSRDEAEVEPAELVDLRLLLTGVMPGQDLALAAVMRALDTKASLRREAKFFAHLYCDRDANAYQGITLYDAWSSDFEFEVPDPDALAYIAALGDGARVLPPLSGEDHERWYPRISDSLGELRNRVHVVRALAAVWFEGRPALPHGYDASVDILQATIALCGEDPAAVSDRLERQGQAFLKNSLAEISSMGNDGWNAGNARRDELTAGARLVRRAVLAVMLEEGLIED